MRYGGTSMPWKFHVLPALDHNQYHARVSEGSYTMQPSPLWSLLASVRRPSTVEITVRQLQNALLKVGIKRREPGSVDLVQTHDFSPKSNCTCISPRVIKLLLTLPHFHGPFYPQLRYYLSSVDYLGPSALSLVPDPPIPSRALL